MVSREKIEEFIRRAYDTACSHGFHDRKLSDEHYMMLVLSEIGEMVEADRKGRRAFSGDKLDISGKSYDEWFESNIKDTLEDELADVVIRICDFCGERGLTPYMCNDGLLEMHMDFSRIFGDMSVCEQCFALSCLVSDISRKANDNNDKEHYLGSILSFCFEFSRFHGFDLEWHVEHKMEYNESRPRKHGKEY